MCHSSLWSLNGGEDPHPTDAFVLSVMTKSQVQAECKVVCHNKLCVTAVSNPCSYVYVSEVVSDGV